MGQKKRGKGGGKRPRLTIVLPRGEDLTLEKNEDYFCSACGVIVARQGLKDHFRGRKHKNMDKLELLYPFLAAQGLSWMEGRIGFKCDHKSCKRENLPAKYEELELHVFNKHFSTLKPFYPLASHLTYSGPQIPKVIYANQGVQQTKRYWKAFDLASKASEYQKVEAPVTVLSNGTKELLVQLVNGGFNGDDLQEMTSWASYLATHGKPVRKNHKKNGIKGGTRMMCHGFRYSYGKIGRFRQRYKPQCYSYGEKLSSKLYSHLKLLFPAILEHLEMVRGKENMPIDVGRIGGSPFTCMSVTRNYSCNPHVDDEDAGYGFFVWLGSDGSKDVFGNETKIYLPSLGYYIEPRIGDIVLCKSNDIVHCSKTIGSTGQLGIALFQKSTFFQGYQILKERLDAGVSNMLTQSWQASEIFYGDV